MRRFYAPASSFQKDRVTLSEGETRHLRDVLRLKPGAEVYVIDGDGHEFRCSVDVVGKRSTELTVIEIGAPSAPESSLDLSLAVAVLKGERFDLVVQKSVELGVNRLIPLETERSDVKIRDAQKKAERWRRIVLEASKQCGRARLMEVGDATKLSTLFGTASGAVLFFAESGGSSFPSTVAAKPVTAAVGPAGGWSQSELDLAGSAGATIVTLGGRILRAETAAIAAVAILQHRFGDLC